MDVYERLRRAESNSNVNLARRRSRSRNAAEAGLLIDLSKKEQNKNSFSKLTSKVGWSLLSIEAIEKRKGLKRFAISLGSKNYINGIWKNKNSGVEGVEYDGSSFTDSYSSIGTPSGLTPRRSLQTFGDADPGVYSEDEDEFVFDNLSHNCSGSSLNINQNAHTHKQQFQHLPKSATQSTSSTPDENVIYKLMTIPAVVVLMPSKPPGFLSESEEGGVTRDE